MLEVEKWAEIRRMSRVERLSQREISKRTGVNRRTVKRALDSTRPPNYNPRRSRPSKLDPHRAEVERLLGPPGTGKTHLATAIGIRACLAGHRTIFASATQWVARLQDAKREGRLEEEITRLGRIPLLIIDEVGYIPFDPEAASLMFALISARYERASLIVT